MKIIESAQINLTEKQKIAIPLFFIYTIIVLTTMVPLPSYVLFGITTIVTILAYHFFKYIIEREEKIIHDYNKKLNDFHEIFINLSEENKKLTGELEVLFTDFDNYVISSKTDLFGRITYASKALLKISGYSEKEMVGKPHNILRHPDMPKEAFKQMWDTIEDGGIWSGEVKNKKKDGGFYWVRAIISPIYDSDGAKIGYNSIRQDITKEKIKEKSDNK